MVLNVLLFLIAVLVMFICTGVFKRLAKRFGYKIAPRALLLCVAAAIIINFTAIGISSFLTARHYILLIVLIMLGAALITKYNDRLCSVQAMSDTDLLWARIHSDLEFTEISDPSCEPDFAESITKSKKPELQPEPDFVPEQPVYTDEIAEEIPSSSVPLPMPEPISEPSFAPITEPVLAEPETESAETADTSLINEYSSRFEAELAARQGTLVAQPSFDPAISNSEVFDTDVYENNESAIEQDIIEEAPASAASVFEEPPFDCDTVAAFTTLDEFLNYADEQKQLHYNQNAIYTYEQALIKYSNDDYAPFIVIDMANICKAAGQYRKAIAIYQLAFTLKTVRGSDAIRKDFHKTLAYLEAVEYILSKHDAPDLPFQDIPADYLEEIEQEFSKRQK